MSVKITHDRNQRALLELAAQPGNDVCADCKSRHPRWAAYNLGIFICLDCASIHRKMGSHVSKIKSLTLDTWSKEQVENGNIKSNIYHNPNEIKNPPPVNLTDDGRDSEMEKYIRAKYQSKKFMKSALPKAAPPKSAPPKSVPPKAVPTRPYPSAEFSYKPASAPPSNSTRPSLSYSATAPSVQLSAPERSNTVSAGSARAPISTLGSSGNQRFPQGPSKDSIKKPSNNPVWDDLISLQAPSQSASLPLQFTTPTSFSTPTFTPQLPGSYGTLSASYQPTSFTGFAPAMTGSFPPFQPQQQPPTQSFPVNSLVQQPLLTGSMSFGMGGQPTHSFLPQQFMAAQPQMQASAQLLAPQPLPPQQHLTSTFLSASPLGQPMQLPQQPSPFNQQPSPAHLSQPPSPYVTQPSLPQFQQQSLGQQPQTAAIQHGNPLGGWTTQGQQVNFPQHQWGVM